MRHVADDGQFGDVRADLERMAGKATSVITELTG
jgi:hypothetical protein